MKSKKVYIGISIIAVILICTVASIFLIRNNIKQANFSKNEIDESTKEAMNITEEEDMAIEETTNEENKVEEQEVKAEETKTEEKQASSEEETKTEEKQTSSKAETKKTSSKTETKTEVKQTSNEETKKEFTVKDMNETMYVKVSGSLNVRSGPATTYSKIGSLKNSAEVSVTGKVDGLNWYRISYNKKVGYVDGRYLTSTKPVQEQTTTESASTQTATQSSTSQTGSSTVANLIIINSRNNTLRYYINGSLARSYSCATGKSSTATPTGRFSVYNKIVNRPYYKSGIAGGAPNNPLGKRWLGLDCYGTKGTTYAIHGTNDESSIGKNVSHGCIRMHNADVEALYDIVPVGTTVLIQSSGKTDKQIAAQYGINIE